MRRQSRISYPFVKGVTLSFILGVIVSIVILRSAPEGEQGLGAVLMAFLFFGGSLLAGVSVAWFYNSRNYYLLFHKKGFKRAIKD
jgi:hypothetical protein